MLQEYIYILQILHSKFLYNYDFTPFSINFTPFLHLFQKVQLGVISITKLGWGTREVSDAQDNDETWVQ